MPPRLPNNYLSASTRDVPPQRPGLQHLAVVGPLKKEFRHTPPSSLRRNTHVGVDRTFDAQGQMTGYLRKPSSNLPHSPVSRSGGPAVACDAQNNRICAVGLFRLGRGRRAPGGYSRLCLPRRRGRPSHSVTLAGNRWRAGPGLCHIFHECLVRLGYSRCRHE